MNEVLLRPVRAAALAAATGLVALAGIGTATAGAAEPWGFEQVTPVNKGGGSVHPLATFQTSPDGNGFLLTATSEFDGVPAESVPLATRYFASRRVDGWVNRPMDPLSDPIPPVGKNTIESVTLASSDLSHVLVASPRALTPGATPGGGNLYVRSTATGAYTLVATHEDVHFTAQFTATNSTYARYLANDGRSALFTSVVPLVPGAPDGRIDVGHRGLYSWTAEDGVRVESVLPESEGGGIVNFNSAVSNESNNGIRSPLPDSGGLDYMYFTRGIGGGPGPAYVRSGGETRPVSVSRIPGSEGELVAVPSIWATGRGGRFMLFSASQPLTSDTTVPLDAYVGDYLYRYDAVEDSLDYVGGFLNGAPVPNPVWQMSQDGRTIVFMSRNGLTPDAPAFDEEAWTTEVNVFVWRDGDLRFLARADEYGAAKAGNLRVLSSNGRYLAFTDNSTGPLSTAVKAGADLGSPTCPESGLLMPCEQVFVYDVDTEELECASCHTDGSASKSEAGDPGAGAKDSTLMGQRQVQTVADDGTAFFTTVENLVETDINGLKDVYEYRDGEHRLLSRASQGMSARFLDATPDGRSVFIATNDPIAATDNDKAVDVYMTREGAGFSYTPPIVEPPCTGGDCRGPFVPVAGLPLAGSVSFTGRGNVGPTPARLSVAGGKSIVGTAARLRVKVPGKGRVTVSGAGVRTVKRSVPRAGTYTVRVALTAKARKALRRSKSTRKRVRVTFTPAEGSASKQALSLTYKAKPSNKKGR